ncbi:hypothetical protein CYMTET_35693 [Cymbomonas tetramitiformis]|uniref:Uncharacterized protein n=1 Tax=Cymbomonas tetramitiformis TaxID=36881 RepID=A0AAE0F8I2_9CHLO|nr:hypothetical protein CYMTET_35693 [Cymbomonas tetramitiformis]
MERTAGQEALPVYYGADGFAAGLERNSLHNKKRKEEKENNFKSTSFIWAPSQDSPAELSLRIFSKYKDGAAGNYAENNHHKLRLSTDVGFVGGAKAYTSIIDCATFADKLLPQLRELELNHFYEQLTGPVRFYADIEWYAQSDPTHVVEGTKIAFLKAFMDCAEESIRSKCKVSADAAVFRDAWRLSEASNEKKASFHVTLIDVGYFSSNQLIKQLQIIQDITERLTAKNAAFAELFKNSKEKGVPLDISPYGNDNSFRLLHCAKKADPQRTLRPVRITLDDKLEVIPDGQYNYLDYVVSHIPDGEHALVPKNLSDLKVNLNSRRNRSKVSGTPVPLNEQSIPSL